jgi:hypothetical protein
MKSHSYPRGVDDPIRRGQETDHDPNTDLCIELASFDITAVNMKHSITVPLALHLVDGCGDKG